MPEPKFLLDADIPRSGVAVIRAFGFNVGHEGFREGACERQKLHSSFAC